MQTLVVDHPLVAHKLTVLRAEETQAPTFRRLADELVTLLAYEATRHIKVERVSVTTPVAEATGVRLARPVPLVVPVLQNSTPTVAGPSGALSAWRRCVLLGCQLPPHSMCVRRSARRS